MADSGQKRCDGGRGVVTEKVDVLVLQLWGNYQSVICSWIAEAVCGP